MEEDEDSHSRLLVTKIRDSFDHPAFSDIKVKSEGKVFYAHKIILNTRGGGWVDQNLRNKQVLDLSCHEDKVVERILKWIYCGSSLVTIEDSQEFKIKILKASTKLSLTDAENLCKKLIASRNEIKMQIHQEIIKKGVGVVKACGTCIGCQTPDCQICRYCQVMKKYGGEGKLRQKCRFRMCSAQIQTKNLRRINQASKEVASERILTDISGVAPVNDSRSVETQGKVILTATGSGPNRRASNTILNTQTAQVKPSSSETLNASIKQIPENLGEEADTVGHGRIESVDEEESNQTSLKVSKKRKERPLSDSEESDGEEDEPDDKDEIPVESDKEYDSEEDEMVRTKKIGNKNVFDKKGKLAREFYDIEDGEDKKAMDLFEMEEEGDLDENDREAEIERHERMQVSRERSNKEEEDMAVINSTIALTEHDYATIEHLRGKFQQNSDKYLVILHSASALSDHDYDSSFLASDHVSILQDPLPPCGSGGATPPDSGSATPPELGYSLRSSCERSDLIQKEIQVRS